MKVLLDTNVVLDLLLNRAPWSADADTVWQANQRGQLEACITASQLTDIFYVLKRSSGEAVARQSVQICLDSLTVLTVDFGIVHAAIKLPLTDFEDAVQLAAAAANGVTAVVTRDQTGFVGASLPVLAPAALIAQMSPPREEE